MSSDNNQSAASMESIRKQFSEYVVPTYARFDLALTRGEGSHVWDAAGRRYLDMGGGIAVCCLGHAHPEVADALARQARTLVHVSNLYYQDLQGRLAEQLVGYLAPGKMFFCNSGAEANEGLFKLARKFGHEEGRFEIITTTNSFHGRTLAGIAATGQVKVRKGFEPTMEGFRQVPYGDLDAVRHAISPGTAAVLIEGIQGEGGINPATPEYLLGLRALCDEKNLLLLMDGVQCGHFRTGRFQSFERILEEPPGGADFMPDAIGMAKSLGGGFPMGAFWIRKAHADLLGPGTHGTTFGGTPLACAAALKILDIIERDQLAGHVRSLGDELMCELHAMVKEYPSVLKTVRGLGFMVGIELQDKKDIPGLAGQDVAASIQCVNRLHEAGLLTIPSGGQVVRFLPPYNLKRDEAAEALDRFRDVIKALA